MPFRTFNDLLALALVVMMVGLWALDGYGLIQLPEAVLGGTIAAFTLIIQFYYRRSPPEDRKDREDGKGDSMR